MYVLVFKCVSFSNLYCYAQHFNDYSTRALNNCLQVTTYPDLHLFGPKKRQNLILNDQKRFFKQFNIPTDLRFRQIDHRRDRKLSVQNSMAVNYS